MGVFSTHWLSPSVSWHNASFTGDGIWAHLVACASRDEISPGPTMEHGTPILGFSRTYTYMVWRTVTKFGLVTHLGMGVF